MKLLIRGERQVGKSTLIRRLTAGQAPLYGVETYFADGALWLRRPGEPGLRDEAHCIGVKGPRPGSAVGRPQVFETLGAELLAGIPPGAVVILDELGYLEQNAPRFLAAVEAVLLGPYRVLGAVKPMPLPHLQRFCRCGGVQVLDITLENREALAVQAGALWTGPDREPSDPL